MGKQQYFRTLRILHMWLRKACLFAIVFVELSDQSRQTGDFLYLAGIKFITIIPGFRRPVNKPSTVCECRVLYTSL